MPFEGYIMDISWYTAQFQTLHSRPPWISFATRGLSAVYTKLGWCEEAMAKMMEAHETFQVGSWCFPRMVAKSCTTSMATVCEDVPLLRGIASDDYTCFTLSNLLKEWSVCIVGIWRSVPSLFLKGHAKGSFFLKSGCQSIYMFNIHRRTSSSSWDTTFAQLQLQGYRRRWKQLKTSKNLQSTTLYNASAYCRWKHLHVNNCIVNMQVRRRRWTNLHIYDCIHAGAKMQVYRCRCINVL